jgi:hypothetical protein
MPLDITDNREPNFELLTGQFRDPDTGEFEQGGPPPDYDLEANRFRSDETGQFKPRAADYFDEPREVRLDALWPEG